MKLLVICILVASATAAQAESLDEKRLRILNDIIKLLEERRQLDGKIFSKLNTILEMEVTETDLTQEYLANCDPDNAPLWRWIMDSQEKRIKIVQRRKKILDELARYKRSEERGGERIPLALLNKSKRYLIRYLKRQRKEHAMVKQLERKCVITNNL